MTTETEARDRAANKLMTLRKAMIEVAKISSATLDKGDAIGAGRRLERINMAANAALDACAAD